MGLIEGEIELIERFIHPGNMVFDVGANIGEWSMEVLKRFPNVVLHQFEPLLNCYNSLIQTYSGQTQNNCIVSDVVSSVPFYYCSNLPSLSTVHRRNDHIEKSLDMVIEELLLPTITLDSYCKLNNIRHIHFLKIDTEGSEFAVLKGSVNLLSRGAVDYVQFEYGGCFLDADITLEEVYIYLKEKGYVIGKITKEDIKFIHQFYPEMEDYKYCNYLAKLL